MQNYMQVKELFRFFITTITFNSKKVEIPNYLFYMFHIFHIISNNFSSHISNS